MFSFNYKKCVDIWNIEWDEICNRLEKNEENLPKFEDLIKDAVFSHVIAQIMEYSKLFTVYPQDSLSFFVACVKMIHPQIASASWTRAR